MVMTKDIIEFWAKLVAIVVGAGTAISVLVMPILKGQFLTKEAHDKVCSTQMGVILSDIKDMKKHLESGNKKFANAERYIVAIAGKLNLKEDEIPKL